MWSPTALVFFLTAGVAAPQAAPAQASAAPAAAPAQQTDAKLEAVVQGLQKAYESTRDFSGKFTQRYTFTMLRRTQESTGEVFFERPGRMRWDYKQPTPKAFIVDGKSLWIHQPADNTAFVNECFKQDGLTASIAFLWGSGNIKEQFDVAWFDGVFGEKTDHHLELRPKQQNSIFAKLILVLDPKSHRVKQSIVVDPQGNVNQFIYSDLAFNQGQKKSTFQFTPPKGTHVSKLPGACAAEPSKAGGASPSP